MTAPRGFPEYLSLREMQITIYSCDMCGCIFLPQYEDAGFYPDRWQIANPADSTYPVDGCDVECECHNLPGYVPYHAEIQPLLQEDLPDEE